MVKERTLAYLAAMQKPRNYRELAVQPIKTAQTSVSEGIQKLARYGVLLAALSSPATAEEQPKVASANSNSAAAAQAENIENDEVLKEWNNIKESLEAAGHQVPTYDPRAEGTGVLKQNILAASSLNLISRAEPQRLIIKNPRLTVSGTMIMPLPTNVGDQRCFAVDTMVFSNEKRIDGTKQVTTKIIYSTPSEDNPYKNPYLLTEFSNVKGDISVYPFLSMVQGEYSQVSREQMIALIKEKLSPEEFMQLGNATLAASQIVYDGNRTGNDLQGLFATRDADGNLYSDCGRKASLASSISPLLRHAEGYNTNGDPHVLNLGELPEGFFLMDPLHSEDYSIRPQTDFVVTTLGKEKGWNALPDWNINPQAGVNNGFWKPNKGDNDDFEYIPPRIATVETADEDVVKTELQKKNQQPSPEVERAFQFIQTQMLKRAQLRK